jgi:hypothetical protein
MATAPRTPGEHHYLEAERVLATVGSLGATPEEATREVGVAIAHAMLCGAASLLGQPFCENDHSLAAAPGLLTRARAAEPVIKCELTLCSLLANYQLAYG